eukprot:PhF_6_TR40589/c0_g1_i1/m.60873
MNPTEELPRDCVHDILTFCDPSTSSNTYLVCQSWYHAVDRLADDLPERIVIRNPRWFPSTSLPKLQELSQYQRTEFLYLRMVDRSISVDTWLSYLTLLPTLREVHVKGYRDTTNEDVETLGSIVKVTSMNLKHTKFKNVSHL